MSSLVLIILFLSCMVPSNTELKLNRDHYIGAVLEYGPAESDSYDSPQEVLTYNIDQYLGYMQEARAAGTDIMVFPEYGLTGLGLSEEEDRARARQFMVSGKLGRNYCPQAMNRISENYNNNDEMLEMLACGAVEFNMYIVVNLGDVVDCIEDESECLHGDGFNMYNTNLVFDRSGVLIAKHWKENLFLEPIFDVPSQPAFTTFTTDFGVNFGTFICFESLWERAFELVQKYPNVSDIVFPTAWVDEVPFLTAPQVQSAWAVSNNVNFLASGFHAPLKLALGSGIFSPSGPLNYTYDSRGGSRIVTAKVPIRSTSETKPKQPIPVRTSDDSPILAIFENISAYSQHEVTKGRYEEVSLCHQDTFCCEASYNISNTDNTRYSLLAYNGPRDLVIPGLLIPIQVCGVIRCRGDQGGCHLGLPGDGQGETFHYLRLSSKDFNNSSMIFPSVLNSDAFLPNWNNITFERGDTEVKTQIQEASLYSAALYGRVMQVMGSYQTLNVSLT